MQSPSNRGSKKNGVNKSRVYDIFTKISVPFYLFYVEWPTKMT